MPKLWDETIAAHRNQVHDAILDAAGTLMGEQGLRAVTMAGIAERAGIGRATLYKYFSDVDAILRAWHHRSVAAHLARLTEVRDAQTEPGPRLVAVLGAYARHAVRSRQGHDVDLGQLLHQDKGLARARDAVRELITGLLDEAVRVGEVRADVPRAELAAYCLHALEAAGGVSSDRAVDRLVRVVLDGLRPGR